MAYELEMRMIEQMRDVILGAGEEIVETKDIMTIFQQTFAQVGADKTGTAGDEDAGTEGVVFHILLLLENCHYVLVSKYLATQGIVVYNLKHFIGQQPIEPVSVENFPKVFKKSP